MFAACIHVECVSIFEPAEGVWKEEAVKAPTDKAAAPPSEGDEEDFLAFCRRALL